MKIIKRKNALCLLVILIAFPFCEREDLLKLLDREPISINLTPLPAVRRINGTIQFRANAVYNSGTTENVTDSTVWSVSGSATANSTPGNFTASPTEGTATINASYTTKSGIILTRSINLEVTDDFFVATTGVDSPGFGTPTEPFRTIEYALTFAGAGMNIRIAQGDYYPSSQIQLVVDGVSLLGGYAADWSHNFVTNKARIYDVSTTGTSPKGAILCNSTLTSATHIEGLEIYGSTVFTGQAAVAINTAGNPTIRYCSLIGGKGTGAGSYSCGLYSTATGNMDIGYSNINGGTGTISSYGISSQSSAGRLTIYNSTINGGAATNTSYGIYIADTGNSIIEYSYIDGGSGPYSYGIMQPSVSSSSLVVRCSTISGGTGTTQNVGIFLQNNNATPQTTKIYNNIIICGTNISGTTDATGILLGQASCPIIANNTFAIGTIGNVTGQAKGISTAYSAQPRIYNNLFIFNTGLIRYGIYEGYPSADPNAVRNNIFFNTTIHYHNYIDGVSDIDWITIPTMETGLNADGTIANGNNNIDPLVVGSGDFHLTTSSPAIGMGLNGIDLAWPNFPLDSTSSFPIDRDGNARPIAGGGAWSIGAYQYVP